MIRAIVAVDKKWGIGKKNDLLFRLPLDMKFFKETTSGHTVVMGAKTWQSLPKKLPNRKNIVFTSAPIEGPDECITDLAKFIEENESTDEEIFIIGGGSIYAQFLDHAQKLYLTEVDGEDKDADVFFPVFDKTKYARKVIHTGNTNALKYEICEYTKK